MSTFPRRSGCWALYHVATLLRALADALIGKESRPAERFYRSGVKRLLAGKSAAVISAAGWVCHPVDSGVATREKAYLGTHHEGMRNDEFWASPIGWTPCVFRWIRTAA